MTFFKNLELKDKKILFIFIVAIFLSFFIDTKLTLFFYGFNEPFKSFFHTATKFGDSLYYLLIIMFFFLVLRTKKKISPIFKNLYDLNIFVFYNIAISGIITQILKHLIGRPRPKIMFLEDETFGLNFFTFNSDFHSFPSGHASTIFSIVFVFYFLFPGIKKYLISVGIFIALTRVVIGAHYLSDIIAGCAISYFVFIYLRNNFLVKNKLFLNKKRIIPNTQITKISFIFSNFIHKYIIKMNYYLKYFLLIILTSIMLMTFPSLDITISGIFYEGSGSFAANSYDWNVYLLRKTILPIIFILIFLMPIIGIFYCLIFKKKLFTLTLNNFVYIFVTSILSAGIIVNGILKTFWGRVRPNDTSIFGGDHPFSVAWQKVSHCDYNCSFVSGDVSTYTLLLALILVFAKPNLNKYAYLLITLIGLTRIMEGGHFFSDVVMSFMITHFIIKILFDFFSQLPDNLNVDKIVFFNKK